MAVERKNVYRRLPLAHVGLENAVSEHTAVGMHNKALPPQIKMFFANSFGKRSFAATDTKVSPGLFIP